MHVRSWAARLCSSSNLRPIVTPLLHLSFILLPPLLPLTLSRPPSRFSRWFQGAASPLSHVGWAGRKRQVALTAPKRQPSMKSSICRSQSAHWRVRASTAAHDNNSVIILKKLNQLLCNRFYKTCMNVDVVCNWLPVLFLLCVFSVWEWLEVLPHQQGQEDAHGLHQERSSLRHREVSRTLSLRRTGLIFKALTAFYLPSFHPAFLPVDSRTHRFQFLLALSADVSSLLSVSYLCFESSSARSSSSKKNKVIKLMDITDIQKVKLQTSLQDCTGSKYAYPLLQFCIFQYKVLSVLPGSGMGISIATPSTQKVGFILQTMNPEDCNELFSVLEHFTYNRCFIDILLTRIRLCFLAVGVWCHDSQRRSLRGHLHAVHEDHDHRQTTGEYRALDDIPGSFHSWTETVGRRQRTGRGLKRETPPVKSRVKAVSDGCDGAAGSETSENQCFLAASSR